MKELLKKFQLLSEEELDNKIGHKALLESGGDYGCSCLLYEGDIALKDCYVMEEEFSEEL